MRIDQASIFSGGMVANLFLLICLGLAAGFFYTQFSLNHDSSWYLVSTAMYLQGAGLYSDILEINPPLAFYLTVPPVALSNALGTDPTDTYILYCVAIGIVSSFWTLAILNRCDLPCFERRVLFVAVLVVLFVLPVSEFGQREHLMVAFAMPMFASLIIRDRLGRLSSFHRIALGFAASVGLLLKPYFLLIPAGMGLLRLWQDRNLSIFVDQSYLAIAGATIAYLAFIFWGHPAYLEFIVPIATEVYASYGMDANRVLVRGELLALVILGIAIWRCHLTSSRSVQMLLVANLSAALGYLLQFKGWNYQILPLAVFEVVTVVWIFVCRRAVIREDALAALSLALALALTLGLQLVRGPYSNVTASKFAEFVESEGKSLLVLSTNVSASFPFVNEVSGKWSSHYSAQWLIPGAYDRLQSRNCEVRQDNCASARDILDFARNSIIADIEQFEPDLIFVDERESKAYFRSQTFEYFDFIAEDQRFRDIQSCYRRVGETLGFGVFAYSCEARKRSAEPK